MKGLILSATENAQDRVFCFTEAKVINGGSTSNAQIYSNVNALNYDG